MKVAILLIPALIHAASISGRVYEGSGAVVPGARISVSKGTGAPVNVISGPDGSYRIDSLTAGAHRLTAAAPGFVLFQRGLSLSENTAASVPVILQLGSIEETLEVRTPGRAKEQPKTSASVRVGGNVRPLRMRKNTPPAYPEAARAAGREGDVVLRVIISVEGKVLGATALEGADAELAAAAIAAVKQWEYEPTLLNGAAVETMATVEVSFKLR